MLPFCKETPNERVQRCAVPFRASAATNGWARQRSLLEQIAKLLYAQTRVTHDATEGERVDGVVARNRENARALGHDDVLALANDREAGLLKGADGIKVVDAGDLGQG